MTGTVTMNQGSVNSGSDVSLNGVAVSYIWKVLTNDEPVPGKFGAAEIDVAGFENPVIRLSGLIDVDEDSTTAGHIKSFAKIKFDGTSSGTGGAIKLVIGAGVSSTSYLKDVTDINEYMWVIIKSFTISFSTGDSYEGQKWNWSMSLVETEVDA